MLLFLSLQKMETVLCLDNKGKTLSPTWLRNITEFSVIVANLKDNLKCYITKKPHTKDITQ